MFQGRYDRQYQDGTRPDKTKFKPIKIEAQTETNRGYISDVKSCTIFHMFSNVKKNIYIYICLSASVSGRIVPSVHRPILASFA